MRGQLQVEARTRTWQRVERQGDQDVYRQSIESRASDQGKISGQRRVRLGVTDRDEISRTVEVEQRVPAGTPPDRVPTNWSALNRPLEMPDGGELRIRGSHAVKNTSGIEVPVSRLNAGVDTAVERLNASELRVRRDGQHVEVTQIDESRLVRTGRVGASANVIGTGPNAAGGMTGAELRGGRQHDEVERVERTARFDLSTDTGRAAYQRFLDTRQLPSRAEPGVDNVASRSTRRSETSWVGRAEANAPAVGLRNDGRQVGAYRDDTTTRRADGTEERVRTTGVEGGNTVVSEITGNGGTEVRIDLRNLDAGARNLLQQAFGGRRDPAERGDLSLRFTPEQFEALRRRIDVDAMGRPQQPPTPAASLVERIVAMPHGELAMRLAQAVSRDRQPIAGQRVVH
ncbi:MAG: hypothetical protein JNK82_07385 [Myxococcaceae bacterium]|nr:hypothetical protein [Myxococcaceae bacterium]